MRRRRRPSAGIPESATTPTRRPTRRPDGSADVWAASAGTDVPSNHAAQITRLVDDLLAGRTHQTTLASTRGTVEFVTAVYASALLGTPIRRADLVPSHPFYADLTGGMAADEITARMT